VTVLTNSWIKASLVEVLIQPASETKHAEARLCGESMASLTINDGKDSFHGIPVKA